METKRPEDWLTAAGEMFIVSNSRSKSPTSVQSESKKGNASDQSADRLQKIGRSKSRRLTATTGPPTRAHPLYLIFFSTNSHLIFLSFQG
jgi:hypothetical protein